MNKFIISIALPICFALTLANAINLHSYYSLENTDMVSKSSSIQMMNKCKDQCLKMNQFFPFKFKFHRYILRQKSGNNKYFEGTCHFAISTQSTWYDWDSLKIFIINTAITADMSELEKWSQFRDKCEDKTLQIGKAQLDSLGFSRVHSNFEYFDDGSFQNLEPFDDFDDLMGSVTGFLQ